MARLVAFVVLAALTLTGPAHAAGPHPIPNEVLGKCIHPKASAAGRKADQILRAIGKNFNQNSPGRMVQSVSKAESRFTRAFTKADADGACLSPGDTVAMSAKVDAFIDQMLGSVIPVCGDGVQGGNEECDGADASNCLSGACTPACECQSCGDGITGPGEQCDDANQTNGDCCDASCQFETSGSPCTDGTFCNGTESCNGAGVCGNSTGNPCPGTECNTCQEATDSCFDSAGTACTDDGNVCTDDRCDGAGTCAHPNNTDPCNDGLFCTQTDTCAGGSCVGSGDPCSGNAECNQTCNESADNCFAASGTACTDDGNVCTDDECNGAGACAHSNNSAPCNDSLFCTATDVCSGGSCVGSGDPCPGTECNTCQEATDSCFDPAGTACTDNGVFCDGPEECDGAGSCASQGDPCAAGGECADICNEGAGNCFDPAGTVCSDDGTTCTADECDGAGTCTHPSSCCVPAFEGFLSFETTLASGTGGVLQKFACSNSSNIACVDNTQCDVGVCVTIIGKCSGDVSLSCTVDAQCNGTCGEVTTATLPLDLELGGLYTGGGLNAVPLPLPIPDQGKSFTKVVSCDSLSGTMTMGPATAADLVSKATHPDRRCSEGRQCSVTTSTTCVLDSDCPTTETCEDRCIFGPQLPIPNPGTPATSVCTINIVAEDASGTTSCDGGATDLTLPLRSVVYLTGDLLSSSVGPVNVAGVQSCPLCVRQCVGGTNPRTPCTAASDCSSGACSASTSCLGGPGDGASCTPETSGAAILGAAYPTSHDCLLDSGQDITANIGGLPVDFALTSGTLVANAVDQPALKRTFSGHCRDVNDGASLAFEGDPAGPACIGCSSGVAVPCSDNSDCQADADTYESCAQRNPGAFSKAAATRITVSGTTMECSVTSQPCVDDSDCPATETCVGACLGDGLPHAANLVSIFDISPTFDATVDAAGDLPGPGAALIQGESLLE